MFSNSEQKNLQIRKSADPVRQARKRTPLSKHLAESSISGRTAVSVSATGSSAFVRNARIFESQLLGTSRATPDGMSGDAPVSFVDPQTYAIIGAAMEVHRELGCGYLETVYRAALAMEFQDRGIEFVGELPIPIQYKQRPLPLGYRADFVCFGDVLVEVKALDGLGPVEQAQVINYLKPKPAL